MGGASDPVHVPRAGRRPDLVDLHSLTDRWRIRRDEEGLPVIPGRRGWVAAHDFETLCVHVTGRPYLLRVLRSLSTGWRRYQVGDDEANLLAPVADLDLACGLVRALRRPVLSEERRAALAAQGRRLAAAKRNGPSAT
ncbi:MAG: hypothetical protein ACREM3_28610 [Candidatus Rokuibacteriota bacterium]